MLNAASNTTLANQEVKKGFACTQAVTTAKVEEVISCKLLFLYICIMHVVPDLS